MGNLSTNAQTPAQLYFVKRGVTPVLDLQRLRAQVLITTWDDEVVRMDVDARTVVKQSLNLVKQDDRFTLADCDDIGTRITLTVPHGTHLLASDVFLLEAENLGQVKLDLTSRSMANITGLTGATLHIGTQSNCVIGDLVGHADVSCSNQSNVYVSGAKLAKVRVAVNKQSTVNIDSPCDGLYIQEVDATSAIRATKPRDLKLIGEHIVRANILLNPQKE